LVDAFDDYRTASLKAVAEHPDIDLLIWPESMFALGRSIIQYDAGVTRPAYWTEPYTVPETARICADEAARTVRQFGTRCLLGTQGLYCRESDVQRFNSAGFYGPDGELLAVYHKMHPVMFGEYVPLGEVLPWLYRLTPMPEGLSAGRQPMSFAAGGLRFSPSICFENTVPHLIRRQLAQLRADGQRVDVLVTLTNDGWFWGSSLLDLHLTCGVFRAVENRKPMLISANTGISAWIDSRGRVLEQGPRRASRTLVVDVAGDPSVSPYTRYGDWFAGLCLLATLAGLAQRFVKKIL
jgi:apolipoprotein N-acyltransferase